MKLKCSFVLVALCSLAIFSGCQERAHQDEPKLVSLQIMDRNGFSETVASKDRLNTYNKVNFLTPQPYQKVLRVFSKDGEGKSHSSLTTYHSNGQVWQYLENLDGRAHGTYQEWHANGKPRIDLTVIDGTADTNELAQQSWLFDGKATISDDEGNLEAEILYTKGVLNGPSLYYHPNRALKQRIPYENGEIEGVAESFDPNGALIETIQYRQGKREGTAVGYYKPDHLQYKEEFSDDLLKKANYFAPDGTRIEEIKEGVGFQPLLDANGKIKELHEYQKGRPEGRVKVFAADGSLRQTYLEKEGMKNGEEWEYYPPLEKGEEPKPKIMFTWANDVLSGLVKTWYPSGVQESSKEISQNKKQGLSFAWYDDGSLMLTEEYHADTLVKGSYFEKGHKTPISKVEKGKGTATLFDAKGRFLQKIDYENGLPLISALNE